MCLLKGPRAVQQGLAGVLSGSTRSSAEIRGSSGGPGEIWGGPQAPSAAANGLEAMYLIALGIPEIGFFIVFIMFFECFLICDVISSPRVPVGVLGGAWGDLGEVLGHAQRS